MTAQACDLGTRNGLAATIIRHFGMVGANGQTDMILADHNGERLYQVQGGKYADLTDRIPAGKTPAGLYQECLDRAAAIPTTTVFVG